MKDLISLNLFFFFTLISLGTKRGVYKISHSGTIVESWNWDIQLQRSNQCTQTVLNFRLKIRSPDEKNWATFIQPSKQGPGLFLSQMISKETVKKIQKWITCG